MTSTFLQLKFVYEYSYMFKVEYDFKFLHFMDNVDAMPNDDKLTLAIEYQNALRTLLGMIPFKSGFEWHTHYYERLCPDENHYPSSDDESEDEYSPDEYE